MGKLAVQAETMRRHRTNVIREKLNESMGPVQPFTVDPVCPKCTTRGESIVPAHCPGYSDEHPDADKLVCTVEGEHLHLQCGKCQYEWRSWCADKPDQAPADASRGSSLLVTAGSPSDV